MASAEGQSAASKGQDLASQHSPCLMVPAAEAAALIRVSLRQWWRLDSMGKIPAAVRIGRAKRWRADELRRWVEQGCPDRETWRSMENE